MHPTQNHFMVMVWKQLRQLKQNEGESDGLVGVLCIPAHCLSVLSMGHLCDCDPFFQRKNYKYPRDVGVGVTLGSNCI